MQGRQYSRWADKLWFIELIALRAMAFFKCRGNGLPQPFGLRNDNLFDTNSGYFGAECTENYVIANQSADWCGDPFP